MIRRSLLCLAAAASMLTPVRAELVESSPNSFLVKTVVTIAAPPATVYDTLVNHLGQWWHAGHTFSGDSKNYTVDARPGGCWCERLPNGGGVEHATVVYADPGKKLRFSGALGPMQEFALTGTLTWDFVEKGGATETTLTYIAFGYRQGGLEKIAPFVDKTLTEQIGRLKNFVEKGTP
jgi:uncharacterized protein YndB with AHSA1/START domain